MGYYPESIRNSKSSTRKKYNPTLKGTIDQNRYFSKENTQMTSQYMEQLLKVTNQQKCKSKPQSDIISLQLKVNYQKD
jgi:hypothetical protein